MKTIVGLLFLYTVQTIHLEEIVDTTLVLRSTITLDCSYSGNATAIQFHWSKVNGTFEETICTRHQSYGKYISEKYMSRLSFVVENSASDVSIILKETSEADIGIYICYVALFPTGTVKKVIAVQADDFGHIEPSSHQSFKENASITLNFLYTLLGDVKQVTVQKFTSGKIDLVASCAHVRNGRTRLSYGFDFIHHSFVNCSNLQNITLIIHKACVTDDGLYQCLFWSDVKTQTISKRVYLQKKGTTSFSMLALICGASSLVIVVIFTIAALCLVSVYQRECHQVLQTLACSELQFCKSWRHPGKRKTRKSRQNK
ncbi:CD226 antigen-like isoform X2 [Hyla sarda]|uniref:CD226 antigen-like isoform X2 n=1 Tax=Hyla sarda TaxID=327740 RepID=UPI0024C37E33|nr:CD226 antigen-like isoform X2 [Hyla sarda]